MQLAGGLYPSVQQSSSDAIPRIWLEDTSVGKVSEGSASPLFLDALIKLPRSHLISICFPSPLRGQSWRNEQGYSATRGDKYSSVSTEVDLMEDRYETHQ